MKEAGELDGAIASYQKALATKPDDAYILASLAEAYCQKGNFAGAIATSRRYLALNQDAMPIYNIAAKIMAARPEVIGADFCFELGNALALQGKRNEAAASFQQALQKQPNYTEAYINLGIVLRQLGQLEEAANSYRQAIALQPYQALAHFSLGNVLSDLENLQEAVRSYEQAIALQPDLRNAHYHLGNIYHKLEDKERSIDCLQKASAIQNNLPLDSARSYCFLGIDLRWQGRQEEAAIAFKKALELEPQLSGAHQHLCGLLRDLGDLAAAREAVDKYSNLCQEKDPIATAIYFISIYLMSGASEPAKEKFLALEAKLYEKYRLSNAKRVWSKVVTEDPPQTPPFARGGKEADGVFKGGLGGSSDWGIPFLSTGFDHTHVKLSDAKLTDAKLSDAKLTDADIKPLYENFLFSMHYLRDSIEANSRLYKAIAPQYMEQFQQPPHLSISHYRLRDNRNNRGDRQLRIGVLSNHFQRHSVGWCSLAVIQELSSLTPHFYLYVTGKLSPDDLTDRFHSLAAKFYRPSRFPNPMAYASDLLAEIRSDNLDVLLDLDSLTVPVQVEILHGRPAPICVSWLGFDAPFASPQNYWLGDWHSLPAGREENYCEQLVRMPNCFVAVAGFDRIQTDRQALRKIHRIAPDQIVYFCVAPGRKFNPDLARAQVAILAGVPDSLLIYKGRGDRSIVEAVYRQECDRLGVSRHRLKFLDLTYSEEEHRQIYDIVDVLLDSYPYNGGTHTLESLWFNLPVVTRVGEQFLSRMGYSFLSSLGIKAGIARSWQEYVAWGVRLGRDTALRNALRNHLVESKQSDRLAPLWNPRQFARDMYAIFEKL